MRIEKRRREVLKAPRMYPDQEPPGEPVGKCPPAWHNHEYFSWSAYYGERNLTSTGMQRFRR